MSEANTRFEAEGDLHLIEQEGGYVADAFVFESIDPGPGEETQVTYLDDSVAEFFGAEPGERGDHHIGNVRVIIERL